MFNIKEIWKPIRNYEGLYEVSTFGRIKSVERYVKSNNNNYRLQKECIRKTALNNNGYVHVILCKDGNYTTYNVHRLVAETFIPNPGCLPEVNHKDEDKENNNVKNLEWVTHLNNIRHSTPTRLKNKLKEKRELQSMIDEIKQKRNISTI